MTQASTLTSHAFGREKLLGHLAMLLFAGLVSGSYSLGGLAASQIGPSAINGARFVIGCSIMGGLAAVMLAGGISLPKSEWRYLLLGALMAVFFTTMFEALRFTDPVSTGAVFTLMPLMSAGFGYIFLRQVPRMIVLASLVVAALGAIWVIFDGDLNALISFEIGRGEAIFFFGVVCHAAYAPLVRRLNRGEPVLLFTFWTLFATGFCIFAYGFREIAATDWRALPPIVWGAIAYLSIFTTAGTFFLLQFASLRLPASKVLAYTYLTPVLIIFYEGLLGHGWVPAAVLGGAFATVCGLLVLVLSPD